jgi:hypothetical protein
MTNVQETRTRKTVWKYEIPLLADEFRLEMPKGADVLHVSTQFGTPQMWVEVKLENTKDMETRKFRVVGTGHEYEDVLLTTYDDEGEATRWYDVKYHTYIGTFQMMSGNFIFHIFEVLGDDVPEDVLNGTTGQD